MNCHSLLFVHGSGAIDVSLEVSREVEAEGIILPEVVTWQQTIWLSDVSVGYLMLDDPVYWQ